MQRVFHVKQTRLSHGVPQSLLLVAVLKCLVGVGCDPASPSDSTEPDPGDRKARAQADYAQLSVETDLRRHDAALAVAFLRGDAPHRAAAARGLGQIGTESALVLLQRGLADPDPAVRAEVSFGLGLAALPLDAWLGAYAIEPEPTLLGPMLQDLGRALDLKHAGPLLRGLDRPDPHHACVGINHLLERDPQLSSDTVQRLLRLAATGDAETAVACLGALDRLPRAALVPYTDEILNLAQVGLRNPVAAVRRAWLALATATGAPLTSQLTAATADLDPTVAALAFHQLARVRGALPAFAPAFEARLSRFLGGAAAVAGAESDPSVLHAALDAAPQLGDSVETVQWITDVLNRLTPAPDVVPGAVRGALHCAAARAFDRIRQWPSRTITCGSGAVPAWVGQTAAVEVLSHAAGSDAVRAVQLKRLYIDGDWHVKHAALLGLHNLEVAQAQPLLLEGLSHDHPRIRAAALESLARFAPRMRSAGQPLPSEFANPLRSAFQMFHVQNDVRGLAAYLAVVRMARLRAELGPVMVLARSGIAVIRLDARALLDEWGHPSAEQTPETVPDPIPREWLQSSPVVIPLQLNTSQLALTLDPQLAPVAVARLIHWLSGQSGKSPTLEVSDWRPAHHLLLASADGLPSMPWRSEESRAPVTRGTVVIPQRQRDALNASLLILLAPAPELEGKVTVVGRITEGLEHLDRASLGTTLQIQ